jgi:UDP-N-acetylmuramoyl-tripeptide--D-alanyl-D-alanine ligase
MFTINEIADKAFKNECKLLNLKNDITITSVDHDSRRIKEGALYVAIKGDNHDGHEFILDAARAGAVACIVEDAHPKLDIPQIVVKDSIYFYGELANYWRKKIKSPFIAITGSNGKTTVKEMLVKMLSVNKIVGATKGNFNNLIGLPYTILGFPLDIELAVLEMGMNATGEIYRLSQIAEPDVGIITNIGKAHIGELGSIEAIFNAKLELFDHIMEQKKEDGIFIVNISDAMMKNWKSKDNIKHRITFSCNRNIPADVKLLIDDKEASTNTNSSYALLIDNIETIKSQTNLKGDYNLCNICCAVALGLAMGIKAKDAVESFKNIQLPEMRSNLINKNGIEYFVDCYNANPESMFASLQAVKNIRTKQIKNKIKSTENIASQTRLVAVVGDMLELGDFANGLHYDVGKELAVNGYEHVFAMGYYAKDYINGFLKNDPSGVFNDNVMSYSSDEYDKLKKDLKSFLKPGDFVLVKASRGVRLEQVLDI